MPVVLITGIQAAGKSTVAQLLAERLPRSVHVRGDLFRRMVVSGRVEMSPDLPPQIEQEAFRQLRLRYRLAAMVTDGYVEAGFTVIMQDVVLGEQLAEVVELIRSRPLLVVVLAPDVATIAAREAGRGKSAYRRDGSNDKDGSNDSDGWAIAQLDEVLRRHTPRLGLWLDSSDQSPEQTVQQILTRCNEVFPPL